MQRNLHLMILAVLLISGCASLPNRFEAAPPGQTKAVVFDIDGTLTPTPFRYWQVREDAVAAVRHFADQGFRIALRFCRNQRPHQFQSKLRIHCRSDLRHAFRFRSSKIIGDSFSHKRHKSRIRKYC